MIDIRELDILIEGPRHLLDELQEILDTIGAHADLHDQPSDRRDGSSRREGTLRLPGAVLDRVHRAYRVQTGPVTIPLTATVEHGTLRRPAD